MDCSLNHNVARPSNAGSSWVILGVGLALGLVNSFRPMHIDDTVYIAIAKQIAVEPLNPYGSKLNWIHVPEPTFSYSTNPPLFSYYLAIWMVIFGDSDFVLHLGMAPWSVLAAWSLSTLCRQQRSLPVTETHRSLPAGLHDQIPALMVLLSPVYLVGMNLMLDVPMLACVATTIACLLRFRGDGRRRWLALASLSATAGTLIKTPAAALAIVVVFAAWRWRRTATLVVAFVPTVTFIGWQFYCQSLYGATQIEQASQTVSGMVSYTDRIRLAAEGMASLCTNLATTFPVWLFLLCDIKRHWKSAVVSSIALLPIYWLSMDAIGKSPVMTGSIIAALFAGAWTILAALGNGICNPHADAKSGNRDVSDRKILCIWLISFGAFVVAFSPFVAARSTLPIQPPLALLLLGQGATYNRRRAAWRIVFAASLLAGLLTWTDFRWASCYPGLVKYVDANYGAKNRLVYCMGHYGWQYYAERAGFISWDSRWMDAPDHAILVAPVRIYKQALKSHLAPRLVEIERVTVGPNPLLLTVWNPYSSVYFHLGGIGRLPWGFSSEPTEELIVYEFQPSSASAPQPYNDAK